MKHFAYVDADNRICFTCSTTDDLPPFSAEHWAVEVSISQANQIRSAQASGNTNIFLVDGQVQT